MTVAEYANLVRAVVPVIRELDPAAKVIVGAVPGDWDADYPGYGDTLRFHVDVDYLEELIRSGVAALVDGYPGTRSTTTSRMMSTIRTTLRCDRDQGTRGV